MGKIIIFFHFILPESANCRSLTKVKINYGLVRLQCFSSKIGLVENFFMESIGSTYMIEKIPCVPLKVHLIPFVPLNFAQSLGYP